MGVSCIYPVLSIIPVAITAPGRVHWYDLPPDKCF